MKEGQRNWTREELILAMNLYCKLPFGKLHAGNAEIIKLSKIIDRTSNAVAYKLVNFASLDPSLQMRGIKGAKNTSNLDKQVWNEFYHNWDTLPYEAEKLLASVEKRPLLSDNEIEEIDFETVGKTKEQVIRARVNQKLFRQRVLSAYNNTCCITGIKIPDLLIASHIRPWGLDESNRLNPCNGIAINALHDKAFEKGLMTITSDYKIQISESLLNNFDTSIRDYFVKYHNKQVILPHRFLPNIEFLKYHNEERFIH